MSRKAERFGTVRFWVFVIAVLAGFNLTLVMSAIFSEKSIPAEEQRWQRVSFALESGGVAVAQVVVDFHRTRDYSGEGWATISFDKSHEPTEVISDPGKLVKTNLERIATNLAPMLGWGGIDVKLGGEKPPSFEETTSTFISGPGPGQATLVVNPYGPKGSSLSFTFQFKRE